MKQFFRVNYSRQSVYYHFQKCSKDGALEKMWTEILKTHIGYLDMSSIQLDGTIVKSSSDAWLTLKETIQKDIEKEQCNKLASILSENIVYKAINSVSKEVDLINESNICEVGRSAKYCIDNDYKKQKG